MCMQMLQAQNSEERGFYLQQIGQRWNFTIEFSLRRQYLRVTVDMVKSVRKVLITFYLVTTLEMPPVVWDTWLNTSFMPTVSIRIFLRLYQSTMSQFTCIPPKMHTLKLFWSRSLRIERRVCERDVLAGEARASARVEYISRDVILRPSEVQSEKGAVMRRVGIISCKGSRIYTLVFVRHTTSTNSSLFITIQLQSNQSQYQNPKRLSIAERNLSQIGTHHITLN